MSIEKGVTKYWTPEQERGFTQMLATARTFAERNLLMSISDLLKYDLRTKQAKRAIARGRLRLAVASDEDLKELAALQVGLANKERIEKGMTMEELLPLLEARVEVLKKLRAKIRARGTKRGELECQQHQE